ncbi:MAG: ROK family protein [Lachnospiraceae bacterium]|nr:ROK family protein [Lachnospiraceae bacterium]
MTTMVLDIGGTAIKSGLYADGSLAHIRETPTEASKGGAHVVQRAKEIIASYQQHTSFQRIGVSTAGQVDPVRGQIIYANENIPGYTGTRLGEILEQEFHVPTAVENDVNAAAIGESVFGAGKDHKDFVCLTYGTGVGGAIFSRGKLYSGSSYSAGEFGAIVTHPEARMIEKDMFSGCYEKYASATALVKSAVQLDPALDNGRRIFERLEEPEVRTLVDRWIMEIVYGLTTIIHMLNPECVILGGGIMEQPYVSEQLREKLYPNIMPSFRHVAVERAALGNRAGMLGAAVLRNCQ